MESFVSVLSGKEYPLSERIHIGAVRANIYALMIRENPKLSGEGYISLRELAMYREQYITEVLSKQIGQIGEVQRTVIDAMENETLLSEKLARGDEAELTSAQRLADRVASFGGSWTFISAFGVFIVCWITLNIFFLRNVGFDPYPFILLNLILSCIAALQAPIIMMSQNRQEEKDRERAKKGLHD